MKKNCLFRIFVYVLISVLIGVNHSIFCADLKHFLISLENRLESQSIEVLTNLVIQKIEDQIVKKPLDRLGMMITEEYQKMPKPEDPTKAIDIQLRILEGADLKLKDEIKKFMIKIENKIKDAQDKTLIFTIAEFQSDSMNTLKYDHKYFHDIQEALILFRVICQNLRQLKYEASLSTCTPFTLCQCQTCTLCSKLESEMRNYFKNRYSKEKKLFIENFLAEYE